MTISPKYRKWIRRFFILMGVRIVISAILYYLVVYRFKEIVQIALDKESKGLYAFDDYEADISLFKRDLVIKDARVYCTDTLHTPLHYNFNIPRIHLGIQSWTELIFHRRLIVDSLVIQDAVFSSHAHLLEENKNSKPSFKASQIVDLLNKISKHLRVKKFSIKNGTYVYRNIKTKNPFFISHVNFQVRNFAKNYVSDHVFSSEDIDLTLHDQHWNMPDGSHDISFKRLHFNGKHQLFELDSCIYHASATKEKAGLFVSADRFYFNSKELASIYARDRLDIDTLICLHPRLIVEKNTGLHKNPDKQISINQTLKHLFHNIHFHYIDIQGGQIELSGNSLNKETTFSNPSGGSNMTKQASLRVYNLIIPSDSAARIHTDSIKLNLQNLIFATRDSMFQLSINKFSIINGDLVLKDARYGPTKKNKQGAGLSFTAPSLILHDIYLGALIDKRIKAAGATLVRPLIKIVGKQASDRKGFEPADSTKSFSQVYTTLHGLKELINVPEFNIVAGKVRYHSASKKILKIEMNGVQARLLPNHLFRSDSLVDIKRSIPLLQIKEIKVATHQMSLKLNDYSLEGITRKNRLKQLDLVLANGNSFKGKNLYWEVLDWDLYQQSKQILFYQLKFADLDINLVSQKKSLLKSPPILPILFVKRLDIDHLHLSKTTQKGKLKLEGAQLCTDQINTYNNKLNWDNTEGNLSNIKFSGEKLNASIHTIHFNNLLESRATGIAFSLNKGNVSERINIQSLGVHMDFQSTKIKSLKIASLDVHNPSIELNSSGVASSGPTVASTGEIVPLDLFLGHLSIAGGRILIRKKQGLDSLDLSTRFNAELENFKMSKHAESMLSYDKFNLDFHTLQTKSNTLNLKIPEVKLSLNKGFMVQNEPQKPAMHSDVDLKWQDASLDYSKGNTKLRFNNFKGTFDSKKIEVKIASNNQFLKYVSALSFHGSNFSLLTAKMNAQASEFTWNPRAKNLDIHSFVFSPRATKEETFRTAKFQTDYISLKSPLIRIHDIQVVHAGTKNQIQINKLYLNQFNLAATRDKEYPFRHGTEKEMPTKLFKKIQLPFRIDSLILNQGKITISENTPSFHKWGYIPLENVRASIGPITNKNKAGEHLKVNLKGNLLDKEIETFAYSESYDDPLSSFTASSSLVPTSLSRFSEITVPLAAIQVQDGRSKTLKTNWKGNKYAAIGLMDFKYNNLKVRLLNGADSSKQSLKVRIENKIASLFLLHSSNSKPSIVYFERDREKFIFNYWIKTEIKGIQSSIGIKSSKKYQNEYDKNKKAFSL